MSVNPILKEFEWFEHNGKQYYDFDEKDIDKLVDAYFNDLSTKRKGIVGYFKWLGVEAMGNTHRGSFEYEGQYLDYVQKSINNHRKKYRINKKYDGSNLFEELLK